MIRALHDLSALLVALALGLALFGRIEGDETVLAGYPVGWACAFRARTGQPCASCGMTRGWVHMAHARAEDARAANPAAPQTFFAACAFVLGTATLQAWRTDVRRRDLARVILFLLLLASFSGVAVTNLALLSG